MTETNYDSKEAFIEAVRDDGAVLGDKEYFTEGEGSSTSYKVRFDDGEVEDVTKADVEEAFEAVTGEETTERDGEPKEVHLGTFYYASAWDDNHHLADLEQALDELGWKITGEVSSGGYQIASVDR